MSEAINKLAESVHLIVSDPPWGVLKNTSGSIIKCDVVKDSDIVTFGEGIKELLHPTGTTSFFPSPKVRTC